MLGEEHAEAQQLAPQAPAFDRKSFEFVGTDLIVVALLLIFAAIYTAAKMHWQMVPAEDALMLMRYATNLAAGHGIVWNVGDPPVEGATDFLFLVCLSLWMRVSHLHAILATRSLLMACHLAGVAFLYYAVRRLFRGHWALAASLALYFAVGPGVLHAANGFSAPFYGLLTTIAWYFACASVMEGPTLRRSILFAIFALLVGLTRPDGVFLAIFMTAAILYMLGRKARLLILVTVAFFVLFGGAYFVWRLRYFGYLLPNPFYKKGGGHLYIDSLYHAAIAVLSMLLFVTPVYVLGLIAPRARRSTIFALIPLVGFAAIWILLSNENNWFMRFQYVTLPIGLMSVPLIWNGIIEELTARQLLPVSLPSDSNARGFSRAVPLAAVLLVTSAAFLWWAKLFPPAGPGSGPITIARRLSKWEDRHYTIFVTEAGVVPYFSHWRAIDAYGLNDAEITHNPEGLTEAYLDRNHPAIISFFLASDFALGARGPAFDAFRHVWSGDAPTRHDISQLHLVMSHYAKTHNYELAARWGIPCAVLVWYVRRDLPEFHEITAAIRAPSYFDPSYGLATNFLGDPPASCQDTGGKITPRD